MMNLRASFVLFWNRMVLKRGLFSYLLWPLSLFYRLGFWLSRFFKRPSITLSVPLIVVGNITVGGTGKTPLVIALAQHFTKLGLQVGIITRGYGGHKWSKPLLVSENISFEAVGDEALLLAKNTQNLVAVTPHREKSIQLLTELGCNLLISDDGLQRVTMPRTVEIAVIDELRLFGNGFYLPAGPLRESVTRLKKVDFQVINRNHLMQGDEQAFTMYLQAKQFYNLYDRSLKREATAFVGLELEAIAGIGNPEKFFATLEQLGLSFRRYPLPDHFPLTIEKINPASITIMTGKDAVKLPFGDARLKNCWYLEVEAVLTGNFWRAITEAVS